MLDRTLRSGRPALLLLAALLLACGGGAGEVGATRLVREADAGTVTPLGEGELLTVELAARLSAGYGWQVDALDPSVLRLAGREREPAAALGGMEREVLRFAGVAAGRTTLSLSYRRPWEPAGSAERVMELTVEVAGPYRGPYQAALALALPAAVERDLAAAAALPSSYSACASEAGAYARCTPVKDQGGCGGCWAFATAGVLENVLFMAAPASVPDLSEQYLISCNREGWSCDGGFVAFDYYLDRMRTPPETEAGAVHEADFPYQGQSAACGSTAHPHHEKVLSWGWTVSGSPTDGQRAALIQRAILDHGPVWTTVCADSAFTAWRPSAGVFRGSGCTDVNHAVVLVGWGQEAGVDYWIMRNSWSARWGDQGYMHIAWGANRIGENAAYVVTPNQPPQARAEGQAVDEGAAAVLDGSGSSDPDGTIRSYAWTQTSGPPVALDGAATARATFTAPQVSADTALGFRLTVQDDRGTQAVAEATVTVRNVDAPAPAPTPTPAQPAAPGPVTAGCGSSGAGGGGAPSIAALLLLVAGEVARRRRASDPVLRSARACRGPRRA